MFCYPIPPQADLHDPAVCLRLSGMGIRQIGYDGEDIMAKGNTRESLRQLRRTLDSAGLSVKTAHPPFGSYNEPFSTIRQNRTGREADLAYLREFIFRCGILGVHAIPLHTGGAMLPNSESWEVDLARKYVDALLPSARKAGVRIAVENTNHARAVDWYPGVQEAPALDKNIWEYDDTGKIIDFVAGFGDPMVGICYDTGHSHLQGRMMEDMEAFAPRVILFHLHDGDGMGNDQHLQPGYGNADWSSLFTVIDTRCPADAPLFVEARPYHGDPALMARELAAIRGRRVTAGPGGYLKKNENTGCILIEEGNGRV